MKKLLLLVLIVFNTIFCFSENLTISVPENHFGIDESRTLIVSHIENIDNYTNTSEFDEIIISLNQINYYFNSIPASLEYTESYIITETNTSNQYTLYFTQLPIILIESDTNIPDEPKVLANFIYSDNEQILTSNIGIERRGGYSQNFPKKTYDLEFWEDTTGDVNRDVQFGNLRSDDDWILDALYNEPLRLRSYLANKLWLDIHTPSYIDDEPDAKSGSDVEYVEIFINGQYNGLYNLQEQVDKKQLKLKSYNGNIRGELYKGLTWSGPNRFFSVTNFNNASRFWGGYEIKYPKDDQITEWGILHEFTDFVVNSSDIDFSNFIWNKFDFENYQDYFIFLNLIRAKDNTGKNLYLAKYTMDEPYFYVPWDLDGCFGTNWQGNDINVTNDIVRNGLFDRGNELSPNNSFPTIANRWFDLRSNILSNDALSNSILDEYNFMLNNKIYERESLAYSTFLLDPQDLPYIMTWLENRLIFLDIYFGEALSIDDNDLTINSNFIYPNPAKDRIYLNNTNLLIGKEFRVYNTLSQLVSKGVIDSDFINIENLQIGHYLIKLDNYTGRFIKE